VADLDQPPATETTEFDHPGPYLATARVQRGLTQQALADQCGLTQSDVSKIEQGLRWPSVPQLLRLAQALARPIQWFLSGTFFPALNPHDVTMELYNLGVVDLRVSDAHILGAFRPPEQILARVVSGDRPSPRIVESIPAVLAWHSWNPLLLEAYAHTYDPRAAHRLGWLADVALTIEKAQRFPGGFVDPLRVGEFMTRVGSPSEPDSLGYPAVGQPLPPVSKRWNITYAASLETFLARATHLQERLAAVRGYPGRPAE
jgi:transcriptional regulator with XRE-family HTH domain